MSIWRKADKYRFLHEELSWSISKVDDELTPIVQRIARRGKAGALNKQSTLDPFFDLSAGALANYAPRKRTTANVSKRLLSVIKQFREAEAKVSGMTEGVEWGAMMKGLDEGDPKGRGTGKSKRSVKGDEDDDGSGDDLDSLVHVRPVKKRKAAVRKTKSVQASEGGLEDIKEDGSSVSVLAPKKRASRAKGAGKGKGKKVVVPPSEVGTELGSDNDDDDDYDGSVVVGGSEKEVVMDISQVPVEGRKKWRRQQQKSWRRAAVANSIAPN